MKRLFPIFLMMAAVLVFFFPAAGANEELALPVAGGTSGQATAVAVAAIPVLAPAAAAPGFDLSANYTKLDINPMYAQFTLKPGETKEMTVSVRNRDTRSANLRPHIVNLPYSGIYQLDSSWISITPASIEVPAGESAKFTLKASVPADAIRGSYTSMAAFTDEEYPSTSPGSLPNYIHQMSIGVNVISPPAVQVSAPYISDMVESGKEYRYTIEVKNTGNTPLQLNPKVGSDSYPSYGPYGPVEPALSENAFSLQAPSTLSPGSTGTLTLTVNVPAAASGYYNGYIDLGIDDPSLLQGEGRVTMSFTIWKQPPAPFIKKFTVDTAQPIEIELTTGMAGTMYPVLAGRSGQEVLAREPSFDATLTGPDGVVPIVPAREVIKGTVSVGGDALLTPSAQAGTYQETSTRYSVTYTAEGKPGTWQLSVMPRNTQNFEYTITLGGKAPCLPSLNTTQLRDPFPAPLDFLNITPAAPQH